MAETICNSADEVHAFAGAIGALRKWADEIDGPDRVDLKDLREFLGLAHFCALRMAEDLKKAATRRSDPIRN